MPDACDSALLPADGGEHAAAAADHALGLAETYGATLHAVFVVDTDAGPLAVSKNEAGSEEALRAVRARADGAGVELAAAVLEGDPTSGSASTRPTTASTRS